MKTRSTNRTCFFILLFGLALGSGCAEDLDGAGPTGGGLCTADDVHVVGVIVHDARDGIVKDSAFVNLTESANAEMPTDCEATVVLVVGSTRTTLQETRQSQYEAGYSDIVPDLPPLTLEPGSEHQLEIDLGSDGSVDVTGAVTLSDIHGFRTTNATSEQVRFAWNDPGEVLDTIYYVQVSDQRDFVFPDNFASGYTEGSTAIQFGGGSEWHYFTATSPLYARIQSDTSGTISSDGRFNAFEWPEEPILQY